MLPHESNAIAAAISTCESSTIWSSETDPKRRLERLFEWTSYAAACISEIFAERTEDQNAALSMAISLALNTARSDPAILVESRRLEPKADRLSLDLERAAFLSACVFEPFNPASEAEAKRQRDAIISGFAYSSTCKNPLETLGDPEPILRARAYLSRRHFATQGLPSVESFKPFDFPFSFSRKLASFNASAIQRRRSPSTAEPADPSEALLSLGSEHLQRFEDHARFLADPRLDANLATDIASHALNGALACACAAGPDGLALAEQCLLKLCAALDGPAELHRPALARRCAYDIHLWNGALQKLSETRGLGKVELFVFADRAALLARIVHKAYDPNLSQGPYGALWNRPERVFALAHLKSLFERFSLTPGLREKITRFEKIAGFGPHDILAWENHVDFDESLSRIVDKILSEFIKAFHVDSHGEDPTPASLAILELSKSWDASPTDLYEPPRPQLVIDALAWACCCPATEFFPQARENFSQAIELFGAEPPAAPPPGSAMDFFDLIVQKAQELHVKFIPPYAEFGARVADELAARRDSARAAIERREIVQALQDAPAPTQSTKTRRI